MALDICVCFFSSSSWWLLQFLNSYHFGEARLDCEPSGLKPLSNWKTCPAMQCEGAGNQYMIGNVTSSSNCTQTTCAYTGYDNSTIFASLVTESTCPGWCNLLSCCSDSILCVLLSRSDPKRMSHMA